MEGMTRKQVDSAETRDIALGGKPMRPRDSATLILLDRSGGEVRVLMGRRHRRHAFMPGKFVFPGGRTDPADSRIPVVSGLDPREERKLIGTGSRASPARARAIALSAIRETYEEAGLLIGRRQDFTTTRPDWLGFAHHGVAPSLENLRFVARAITPPGRVRRFDTRFLACFSDAVAVRLPDGGPTDELEELAFLTFAEAAGLDLPAITKTILAELARRLADDPDLSPGGYPVPFFRMLRGRMARDLIGMPDRT